MCATKSATSFNASPARRWRMPDVPGEFGDPRQHLRCSASIRGCRAEYSSRHRFHRGIAGVVEVTGVAGPGAAVQIAAHGPVVRCGAETGFEQGHGLFRMAHAIVGERLLEDRPGFQLCQRGSGSAS